jgi:hypothetical protein
LETALKKAQQTHSVTQVHLALYYALMSAETTQLMANVATSLLPSSPVISAQSVVNMKRLAAANTLNTLFLPNMFLHTLIRYLDTLDLAPSVRALLSRPMRSRYGTQRLNIGILTALFPGVLNTQTPLVQITCLADDDPESEANPADNGYGWGGGF